MDRDRQLAPRWIGEPACLIDQARRRADEHGQRRAQIVRDRIQQRVAQALGFGTASEGGGLGRELHTLDRHRDLASKGFQKMSLLGHEQALAARGQRGHHAHQLVRSEQRQVQSFRAS